jgi:hypothetical protein
MPAVTTRTTYLNVQQLSISSTIFIYDIRLVPGINIDYFTNNLLQSCLGNTRVLLASTSLNIR